MAMTLSKAVGCGGRRVVFVSAPSSSYRIHYSNSSVKSLLSGRWSSPFSVARVTTSAQLSQSLSPLLYSQPSLLSSATLSPQTTHRNLACACNDPQHHPHPHRGTVQVRASSHARVLASAANTAPGEPFTVTTPLYYVNAAPHMGSAYPTIAADALARFYRMYGRKVRFVTGTDEHGEKIALAAEKRGMSPQDHCDDIVRSYQSLWSSLDISYDSFIRTTDPYHEKIVEEMVQRVEKRGDIYKAKYEGWYCVDCEEYKDEDELDKEHNCATHRKPCQHRSEENYFFRLTAYRQQLEDFLESNPEFVQPPSRRNEVLSWVKAGVRDFSISRANVQWGIPLPIDPKQTVYVWFDALNGYLSALQSPQALGASNNTNNTASGSASAANHLGVDGVKQDGWPASVHIIGKDILRFHAVYWPAMLMSAGLPLPHRVYGHGFLTKDGLKMGKSLGNVLDPVALVGAYGADAVRYYFMSQIPFGVDGDFAEQRFRDEVNSKLANDIGNLLNRSLNVLSKNGGSK